jgi:hypothetical protein
MNTRSSRNSAIKANEAWIVFCCGLFLALLISPSASAQSQWKGTVSREGGVTVVRNPKEPIFQTPLLELHEELSLGGPDARGEYAFGQVQAVTVDDSGSIYVLDRKNFDIKVFGPSGQHLRTFGRAGQGPGEFEYPYSLSLDRGSGELMVHQLATKLDFFRTDGTFLRDVPLKTMMAISGIVDSKGRIYVMAHIEDDRGRRFQTKILAPDGSEQAMIAEYPYPKVDHPDPFRPSGSFVVDRDDNLLYGYPRTYEIRFFRPSDHKEFKRIERPYDPVAVTAGEREAAEKRVPYGSTITFDFSKYHSAYRRFFTSDLGHVFVETWEATTDGRKVHDIFDAEGRFVGSMPLRPQGLTVLRGKYYALEEDEDGYQLVKRYAVTWKIR